MTVMGGSWFVIRMEDERIPSIKVLNGKFHNTRPVGKPRREDVVRRDTSQILGIRGWSRRAEIRTRLLMDVRAQKRL